MRILYLHQYFNTPRDSGGTRSYEMARRLVASGHKVHVITSDRSSSSKSSGWYTTEEAGINVHWLCVPYSDSMGFSERITAFMYFAAKAALKGRSIKADLVFATSTPLTIALPAVYAARHHKIPMVFEVRDLWPELPIAIGALKGPITIMAARWLEHFAYKNAAQVIALSPGMKAGVTKIGYPDNRTHVIPNGADLDLFNVSKEVGLEFRRHFHWLQDRPLVVYTGTIGRMNGVDYLARLASIVHKIMPEIRFLVVGDGAESLKLHKVASELDVLGKNFFMLERLPKLDIPAVLSAADMATSLFIDMPEMWVNSANKFFDALASGTPVAINYLGWQAKLLNSSGAGIVLNVRDLEQSALTLTEALSNREWLVQAGLAARRLAEGFFSRDVLAKQLESVLLRAVDAR